MLDRRLFLKGLTASVAGLLVPGALVKAEAESEPEPVRRLWALNAGRRNPMARLWGEDDSAYLQRIIDRQVALGRAQIVVPGAHYVLSRTVVMTSPIRVDMQGSWLEHAPGFRGYLLRVENGPGFGRKYEPQIDITSRLPRFT